MNTKLQKVCWNCRFFEKMKGCLHGSAIPFVEGICRRFPPSQPQSPYQSGQGDFWPIIIASNDKWGNWCGEFKLKSKR